ncbi:CrcB-like protein [Cinnamomum micranthum f. kanehirae]|uniref:CrcB-like protein n=1 Tax=Cinnamomum micranthum f. kanehirae TaxID=337451 RepID=A0A443N7E1_9MAGN|nr:CrcB-like protein [Cinnamomum micranthum f. kanehirae]
MEGFQFFWLDYFRRTQREARPFWWTLGKILVEATHGCIKTMMESGHLSLPTKQQSFGRNSTDSAPSRTGSMSFSHGVVDLRVVEDIQDEIDAQAGDSGRRAWSEDGFGGSCRSLRFSIEESRRGESGVVPFPDESLVQLNGFWIDGASVENVNRSPLSPLQSEIVSPLSSDGILCSKDMTQNRSQEQNTTQQDNQKLLLYISCFIHLAVFGILGVFMRYLLQKLFGPRIIGWTNDDSTLYLDLPSNMVGSFLMGWLGIIYKGNISRFSDLLAIGLTTGFLGSLTTFSGWNQKMLELASNGKWAFVVIGYSTDILLVVSCIYVGVATAKGFRWLLIRLGTCTKSSCKVDFKILRTAILLLLILLLSVLWAVGIALLKTGLEAQKTSAQLWLACIVGPPGVWLRWFLAGYNGRGFGRAGSMKWVPFGTLTANVLAAIIMAGLATIKKAVSTKGCDIIINGIQLGFLGCLSTVSTFVAEVYAMNQSNHPWRAYAYTIVTILLSFVSGTLEILSSIRCYTHQWHGSPTMSSTCTKWSPIMHSRSTVISTSSLAFSLMVKLEQLVQFPA